MLYLTFSTMPSVDLARYAVLNVWVSGNVLQKELTPIYRRKAKNKNDPETTVKFQT